MKTADDTDNKLPSSFINHDTLDAQFNKLKEIISKPITEDGVIDLHFSPHFFKTDLHTEKPHLVNLGIYFCLYKMDMNIKDYVQQDFIKDPGTVNYYQLGEKSLLTKGAPIFKKIDGKKKRPLFNKDVKIESEINTIKKKIIHENKLIISIREQKQTQQSDRIILQGNIDGKLKKIKQYEKEINLIKNNSFTQICNITHTLLNGEEDESSVYSPTSDSPTSDYFDKYQDKCLECLYIYEFLINEIITNLHTNTIPQIIAHPMVVTVKLPANLNKQLRAIVASLQNIINITYKTDTKIRIKLLLDSANTGPTQTPEDSSSSPYIQFVRNTKSSSNDLSNVTSTNDPDPDCSSIYCNYDTLVKYVSQIHQNIDEIQYKITEYIGVDLIELTTTIPELDLFNNTIQTLKLQLKTDSSSKEIKSILVLQQSNIDGRWTDIDEPKIEGIIEGIIRQLTIHPSNRNEDLNKIIKLVVTNYQTILITNLRDLKHNLKEYNNLFGTYKQKLPRSGIPFTSQYQYLFPEICELNLNSDSYKMSLENMGKILYHQDFENTTRRNCTCNCDLISECEFKDSTLSFKHVFTVFTTILKKTYTHITANNFKNWVYILIKNKFSRKDINREIRAQNQKIRDQNLNSTILDELSDEEGRPDETQFIIIIDKYIQSRIETTPGRKYRQSHWIHGGTPRLYYALKNEWVTECDTYEKFIKILLEHKTLKTCSKKCPDTEPFISYKLQIVHTENNYTILQGYVRNACNNCCVNICANHYYNSFNTRERDIKMDTKIGCLDISTNRTRPDCACSKKSDRWRNFHQEISIKNKLLFYSTNCSEDEHIDIDNRFVLAECTDLGITEPKEEHKEEHQKVNILPILVKPRVRVREQPSDLYTTFAELKENGGLSNSTITDYIHKLNQLLTHLQFKDLHTNVIKCLYSFLSISHQTPSDNAKLLPSVRQVLSDLKNSFVTDKDDYDPSLDILDKTKNKELKEISELHNDDTVMFFEDENTENIENIIYDPDQDLITNDLLDNMNFRNRNMDVSSLLPSSSEPGPSYPERPSRLPSLSLSLLPSLSLPALPSFNTPSWVSNTNDEPISIHTSGYNDGDFEIDIPEDNNSLYDDSVLGHVYEEDIGEITENMEDIINNDIDSEIQTPMTMTHSTTTTTTTSTKQQQLSMYQKSRPILQNSVVKALQELFQFEITKANINATGLEYIIYCVIHALLSAPTQENRYLHEVSVLISIAISTPIQMKQTKVNGVCIACSPIQIQIRDTVQFDTYDAPYLLVSSTDSNKTNLLESFWKNLYDVDDFPLYSQSTHNDNSYLKLSNTLWLNINIYKKRIGFLLEPCLCEANAKGFLSEKKAHIIIPSEIILTNNLSKLISYKKQKVINLFYKITLSVINLILNTHIFNQIATIEFQDFPSTIDRCGRIKHGEIHHCMSTLNKNGILLLFPSFNPQEGGQPEEPVLVLGFTGPNILAHPETHDSSPAQNQISVSNEFDEQKHLLVILFDRDIILKKEKKEGILPFSEKVYRNSDVQKFDTSTIQKCVKETVSYKSSTLQLYQSSVTTQFTYFLEHILPNLVLSSSETEHKIINGFVIYPSIQVFNKLYNPNDLFSKPHRNLDSEIEKIDEITSKIIESEKYKFQNISEILQKELDKIAKLRHRGNTLILLKNKIRKV